MTINPDVTRNTLREWAGDGWVPLAIVFTDIVGSTAMGVRLNNLAGLLEAQGDLTAARPLLERALAICEQALGPDHPHTNRVRQNLASLVEQTR